MPSHDAARVAAESRALLGRFRQACLTPGSDWQLYSLRLAQKLNEAARVIEEQRARMMAAQDQAEVALEAYQEQAGA